MALMPSRKRCPNVSAINRASSRVADSETAGRTSSRARTDANDSTHHANRSVTSKINRYKKFERELEQHKAQLEELDRRNREREAAAKAKTWSSASKSKMSSIKYSDGKDKAETKDRDLRRQYEIEAKNA